MVVYLINDTDVPIAGAVGENVDPHTQVKVGGFWLPDGISAYDCGTVASPVELPPRHVVAFGEWYATKGDLKCDRRFAFRMGEQTVNSNSFPGICNREDVESRLEETLVEPDETTTALQTGRWWERGGAGSMEEFVAVLELARCHSQFGSLRRELMERLRSTPKASSTEERQAMKGIAAVLGKPWLLNNDKASLVARCIVALQGLKSETYGAPENFPALIWRHLAAQRLDMSMNYMGGDSHPLHRESLVRLVELATSVVETSTDTVQVRCAAWFLASYSLDESLVPVSTFREFLESGKSELLESGLAGLAHRKLFDEGGEWLALHLEQVGSKVADCLTLVQPTSGVPKEWEMKVIGRALEFDPLKVLASNASRLRAVPPDQFPEAWKTTLRQFLQQQFTQQNIASWKKRSDVCRNEPDVHVLRTDFGRLDSALKLMNQWNDPADVELLRAFLDFPASTFLVSASGVGTMNFTARATAAECLASRNLQVPSGLVTKKLVALAAPEPGYRDVARKWITKWPWVAPFLAGIAFMAVVRWLGRKRIVRLTRANMTDLEF